MTAGQFFLYLLIIIILRESLASAASPTSEPASEEPPSSLGISTIPAGTVFHESFAIFSHFIFWFGIEKLRTVLRARNSVRESDVVFIVIFPFHFAVNTEAPSGFNQLHGYQTVEDLLEVVVDIGEDNCEPDQHMLRLVNRPKCTSSSLRIDFRSLSWSSPKLL